MQLCVSTQSFPLGGCESMTSLYRTDLNRQIGSLSSKFFEQVSGSCDALPDDTSSEEEMREPIDDTPLNLSDEENASQMQNNVFDNYAENAEENNEQTVCKPSCELDNVSKTKRDILQADQQSHAVLTANLLYEVAKPKPPPRLRKKKIKLRDNEDASKLIVDPKSAKSILLGDEPKQSRLETMSRKESRDTGKAQDKSSDQRNLKSEFPAQNTEYLTISPKRSESTTSASSGIFRIVKSDTSSITTPTSGYFSRRSDSASLTSSNSNASSTSSAKRQVKEQKLLSHSPRTETKNPAPSPPHNNEAGIDSSLEEDVFPVKSWVESSEYASIAIENAIKENIQDTYESVSTEVNATKQKIQDENDSVLTQVKRTETKPEMIKKSTKRGNDRSPEMLRHVQTTPVTNSISMVEQPQLSQTKSQHGFLQNGVKFRVPGTRSKKDEALRQSRDFARMLKQLSEDSYNKTMTQTPPMYRHSTHEQYTRENKSNDVMMTSGKLRDVAALKTELSSSMTKLNHVSSSEKLYNTVSGATGRHLSQQTSFFLDEYSKKQALIKNHQSSESSSNFSGSTWSLNPALHNKSKPTFGNRLKGAFSFQNIKKAISMERLNEDDRKKSASHSYLNELGEDISQLPQLKTQNVNPEAGRLYKTTSISSIFTTVRMRKRRSRERRAAKARNTIAVDPRQVPGYQSSESTKPNDVSSEKVGSPGHFRPIGRVLEMNVREGSLLVELDRPSSGPFGFYIAKRKETGNVYISSLSDSYPEKMYAGLMRLGDEITEINGYKAESMTVDEIYDIIFENKKLVLRVKPSQIHVV